MIALIQRVTQARVEVEGQCIGEIAHGLLALIGVQRDDDEKAAARLVERMLGYRVFADDEDRMNLNVMQVDGGLLLVPQFTLAADTRKGMRPSFSSAAPPDEGARLFQVVVDAARARWGKIATGEFGADMQVTLTNDGPVTFWLET